ncbi:hypothetical protein [Actinoalloteichus spitiensis]|uniref:hypothetical protein n=1 Tax=Actinoalloteichus spitiensis TaxID=252394 RepID=UPI0012F6A9E8|nr:hypothetical protein [Actinoalloteichus spitiensis]
MSATSWGFTDPTVGGAHPTYLWTTSPLARVRVENSETALSTGDDLGQQEPSSSQ